MDRKLNIMIVVEHLGVGGVQTRVLNFIRCLCKKKHRVIVVRFGKVKSEIDNLESAQHSLPNNLPYYSLIFRNKAGALFQTLRLISILKKEKVDIIHVHNTYPIIFGFIASKIKRVPLVCTIHGIFSFDSVYISLLSKGFNRIIAISEEVKNHLIRKWGISENRISVIPNAVDLDDLTQNMDELISEEEILEGGNLKIIAYIGRLDEDKIKGCIASIRAMEIVIENNQNARMIIVGGGKREREIQKVIRNINFNLRSNIIQMVGEQINVIPYMGLSDIVIGAGCVSLEAMACGKPVVLVSNEACGGYINPKSIREISDHNFSGRHSSEKPIPNKIAQLITTLINNERTRKRIASFSKEYVKSHHDVEKIVDMLIRTYKEAIFNA